MNVMVPNSSACLWVIVQSAPQKIDSYYVCNSCSCKQLAVFSIVVLSLDSRFLIVQLNASNLWQCLKAVGQQYLPFANVSSKLNQVTFTFFFVIL